MKLFLITLLEIIYLIYTFWFMKTRYYINHPLTILRCFELTEIKNSVTSFFKHPIYKGTPENYICSFGKGMIIVLSFYLTIRLYLITVKQSYSKNLRTINNMVLCITFLLSWMNMNAMIYLVPFLIVEFYLICKH